MMKPGSHLLLSQKYAVWSDGSRVLVDGGGSSVVSCDLALEGMSAAPSTSSARRWRPNLISGAGVTALIGGLPLHGEAMAVAKVTAAVADAAGIAYLFREEAAAGPWTAGSSSLLESTPETRKLLRSDLWFLVWGSKEPYPGQGQFSGSALQSSKVPKMLVR